MVNVIEYANKNRYMCDMKTERWWRVPELKEKVREREEDGRCGGYKKGEEEEFQTGHHGPAGNLQT